MTTDIPLLLLVFSVVVYWLCVAVMMLRSRMRQGSSGVVPRLASERLMWSLWVPNIAAWIVLPVLAVISSHAFVALPETALQSPIMMLFRWAASVLAVMALLATIPCWIQMGSNWSIAVEPERKTDLITHGLFAICRNPIYALNMALMLMSVIVVWTVPMAIVAIIHVTLVHIKVLGEESHLRTVHGNVYVEYCRRTARFLPVRLARQ